MISDIAPPAPGTDSAGQPMRFSVDGWDPSYGASLEVEEQLQESTATVTVDVELPATRWQAIDATTNRALPAAILFVDGVRRQARRRQPCVPHTQPGWCAALESRRIW
jgi:hypothetical protein